MELSILVLTKLLLHPVLMLALGSLLIVLSAPLSPYSPVVLALVAALPSAGNVPMLAERYGVDSGHVARVVLLPTTLAFVRFSVAVTVVQRLDLVSAHGGLASPH